MTRYAVGLPNIREYADPRLLVDLAAAAEAGGWDGLFLWDHLAAQFLPRPVQRPRIPIWVAGRWPARRPFRRAARWDGVFPTFEGVGHAEMPDPEQFRDAIRYALDHRGDDRPFDVALEGQTE